MKFFMLLAAAAMIVGAVYHTEVSHFVAGIGKGSSSSRGGSSVAHSFNHMNKSSRSLMGRVGSSLGN
jgi:hypothetical protein